MSELIRKRRCRFSLRTLFVALTILACWLGWNVNLIQERRRMRYRNEKHMNFITDTNFGQSDPSHPNHAMTEMGRKIYKTMKGHATPPTATGPLSTLRRWLGDEEIELILVHSKTDHDLARAAFPEASVFVHGTPFFVEVD